MYRLVRIEGFHNFQVYSKLKFVLYDGSKYKSYKGYVNYTYFISFDTVPNHQIFEDLDITDTMKYCSQYSKVKNGDFPYHNTLEELKTTINSFFKLNNHIDIPSLYKVGDKVRIKSQYDESSTKDDYSCAFTKEMLKDYGGKICTIKHVGSIFQPYRKHYLEPYCYILEENDYNWSAAMFESKQNDSDLVVSSKLQIVKINQIDSKRFRVHYTNGDYDTADVSYGFLNYHNKIFKKFEKFNSLTSLLRSELTCVGINGYEPFIDKQENIWVFIDHLKYRFGTEECKKTINPEFYKYLKKKPEVISDKTEVKQTKTQENAYQFCKMRGTVRVGDVPEGNRICGKRSKASISSRPLGYRKVVGY